MNIDRPSNSHHQNALSAPTHAFPRGASELIAAVQETTLLDYWRMINKRGRLILLVALVVFSLVAIVTLKMTRKYEAIGRIMVSRDNGDVIADQLTQQAGGGGGGGGDLNTEIETQANIVQSDSLALSVIQQMHLYQEPDFAGKYAKANYDGGVTPLGTPPDMDPRLQEQMLKIFKGDVSVVEVPNTRIIEIHFFSPNPKLAADVAEQIAVTLEQRGTQARYDATTSATQWLGTELNDLKHQVEQSEQDLVEYQKKAGIVGLDDKQNTIMTRLDDLNHALTLVENDRATKEANFQSIQSQKPELSAAVPATSQIYKLREQETDLKGQYAQAMAQFGDQYPKAVAIANQLKELQSAIAEENQRIAAELKSDYQISKSHEQSLDEIFQQQKQDAVDLSERSVEYKILEHDAESYRDLYESLTKTLKQAEVLASLQSSNISVIDTPVIPSHPSRPNIPRNLAIGAVVGLAFGIASAFTFEMLDNRIYRPEEIPAVTNLPVLASIPFLSRSSEDDELEREGESGTAKDLVGLVSWQRPRSELAEAYRSLRTAILLSSSEAAPRTILVTSGLPQEGKSTTAFNVATVLAQRGGRVLLIDADLRRPTVHELLGLDKAHTGLTNVLTSTQPLKDAVCKSSVPNLEALPAGPLPPNPAELLGSATMRKLLEQCKEEYDFVIVDAPPVLSVTDAVVLSVEVDAVLVVVRAGASTKHCIRKTSELLSGVGARALGVVVNAMRMSSADGYYYYGKAKYSQYYSSYGEGDSSANGLKPKKREHSAGA